MIRSAAAPAPERTVTIPFRACGETVEGCESKSGGIAGIEDALNQIKAEELAFYAAVALQNRSAGGTNTQSGGRYPRGCVGGESACIPSGPCVLPQRVCDRESSAINKYNYGGSGASGKYQVLHSTWAGYGGHNNAADAPEDVQDAWAREAYAAAGCRPWGGC